MPDFDRSAFGDEFVWGVASSAPQIEGAANQYGKGPSIWDEFCARRSGQFGTHHVNHGNNFYHLFNEDLALMARMNIRHFRFSLAWTRLLPEGQGRINQQGVDFYHEVIDCCLNHGITPWVTLYHWDLPMALEKMGGWANRDNLYAFAEYVKLCAGLFGDKVSNWMVLNEPMGFTGAGYFLGIHAPGRKGLASFLPAAHHACLAQRIGADILRNEVPHAQIGTTYSLSHLTPGRNLRRDLKAVQTTDALLNRLFLEPVLGLGYPVKEFPILERIYDHYYVGDEDAMHHSFDFIGVQVYTREVIRHSWSTPLLKARVVPASRRDAIRTTMNWEVFPESIYYVLKRIASYPQVRKIIVTENGAAFRDSLDNGKIHDTRRIQYLSDHLEQVLRAKREGVPVEGYFNWTFTDNFEWAAGLNQRFGLVYVDYKDQKRYVKDSGIWYARFLGQ